MHVEDSTMKTLYIQHLLGVCGSHQGEINFINIFSPWKHNLMECWGGGPLAFRNIQVQVDKFIVEGSLD